VRTKRHASSDAGSEKATQINGIMEDVMRQYDAGAPVDVGALERAHPELMPELGDRLRALRAIGTARERALWESQQSRPPGSRNAWLEEDLEFLRRSLSNYEVLERVRYGGQGVVYKAKQRGANRLVAIKVLLDGPLASDCQRHRFEREIELISRLHHPNIITLYETGTVRSRRYFAMEFVDGSPIDDYALLHDLTPREIVSLFIKVCRAVSYAHQNGVIHRDLSPTNILVDEAGEPHVFDFGLAKDIWADDDAPAHTLTGQVFGTLQYLSPEQAGGLDGKADVRSDIYTLAVVLYELLTDGFPYPIEGGPQQVRHAILTVEAEPLRKAAARGGTGRMRDLEAINRDLQTILAKALAKRKEERYQSAAAFADDLERCLAGDAIEARRDSHFYLLRKTLRRYRVPVAATGLVLLTLAVSAIAVTASWIQARIQRDNAREAARVAYDLFDTAVTDFDTSVRPLAGGVAVRNKMIAGLADRLPRLKALIESDEALAAISTRLAEKQGDLAHEQGQHADAARYYEAFLEGSLRLVELEPSNPSYLDSAGRAYRKQAEVSDNPTRFYERGIRFAEEVFNRDPERDAARYNLCQMHVALGEHLLKSEHYREALEPFDRALGLWTSGGRERNQGWSQMAAVATSAKGRILLKLGEAAAGLAELTTSLRIREHIVEARPADTLSRHELMKSCVHVATAQRELGHVDEARELLQKAAAIGELLRAMDPTVLDWGLDLHGVYGRLARLHLDSGALDQAQGLSDRAFALAEELVSATSRAPAALQTLAFAHILRGQLLLAQQSAGEAYAEFEKAAAIRASLAPADAENPAFADDLAVAHSWLGKSSRKLRQLQQAAGHYQMAYEIRRDLYDQQPHVVDRALDLIRSQTNLAVAYLDCNTEADDAAADALLREAEGFLETLRTTGKLSGFEEKYDAWISAIRTNRGIIRDRRDP